MHLSTSVGSSAARETKKGEEVSFQESDRTAELLTRTRKNVAGKHFAE
jgi:hypothetical protein